MGHLAQLLPVVPPVGGEIFPGLLLPAVEGADKLPIFLPIRCKIRPALGILPQIVVEGQQFPVQSLSCSVGLTGELQ